MGFFDQFFSGGNSEGGGNPSGANNPYKDSFGGTEGKQAEGRIGGTGGDMGSLMRNLKNKKKVKFQPSNDPGAPALNRGGRGQVVGNAGGSNFITQLISMLGSRQ
tara:strand:- start:8 stop:322 length:315 start_codon:yes stop_codon:yes gene_type:complete